MAILVNTKITTASISFTSTLTPVDQSGQHYFTYDLPDLLGSHYNSLLLKFDVSTSIVGGSTGNLGSPSVGNLVFPNSQYSLLDIYLFAKTSFISNEIYNIPSGVISPTDPTYIPYLNKIYRIYNFNDICLIDLRRGLFKNSNVAGERIYSLLFYNCSNNNIVFNTNTQIDFYLRTVQNG
jgi:hypothetical protein